MAYGGILPMNINDARLLGRLVRTEVPNLNDTSQQQKMLNGVVENVVNRAVSPEFTSKYDGGPSVFGAFPSLSVQDVANQKNQYSAINGPTSTQRSNPRYVQNAYDASPEQQRMVNSHLFDMAAGAPQDFPGNVNYLNPNYSSPAAMAGWGKDVVAQGQVAGTGNAVHYYGVAPNNTESYGRPQFSEQDLQALNQSRIGIGQGMQGPLAADSIDRANEQASQVYGRQIAANREQNLMSNYDNSPPSAPAPAPTLGERITSAITSPFSAAAQAVGGMFSTPADSAPRPPAPVQQPQRPVSYSPLNAAPNPAPVTSQPLAPLGMPAPSAPLGQSFNNPAQPNDNVPFSPTPGISPVGNRPQDSDPAHFSPRMQSNPYAGLDARAPTLDDATKQKLAAAGLTPAQPQQTAPLGMPSPQSMPATPGLAPSGRPMASMSPQQQIMGQYQSNFGLPGLAAGTASELGLPNADPSIAAAAQAARAAQPQHAPFSMPQRPVSPTPAPAAVSPTAPPGTPAQPQAPLGQVAKQAATGLLSAGLPVAAAALPGAPLAAAAIASAMPQAKPVTPTPIAPSVAPAPLSPAPSVAPGPQVNPNAPTVGTTGLPAGPEMNPGLNTTARPTTMGQIGGGLKSAAKVGRTAMAGAKVGGLVAGPVGGLVGLGLGAGIPLAGMAMDAAGTNVNQLFGGPVPHPGSAPATSRDVVPFAAPSVLSQVNRMDLGPAPQGYSYGYSPFGNNVSLVSNNANEAAHIAATGPGILGAFGFGTSKDGYNNGAAAAAQNAATNTAKATQSKTDAKANATQSQNSSSSNSSSKSSGSGSGKTGGGQNGNGDKKQSSY